VIENHNDKGEEQNEVAEEIKDYRVFFRTAHDEKIDADVGFVKESVGRHQHEVGPVQKIAHLEGPERGGAEKSAGNDFENDQDRQGNHQPCKKPSRPIAYAVDFFSESNPFVLGQHSVPLSLGIS
jgi:hypothetical protein